MPEHRPRRRAATLAVSVSLSVLLAGCSGGGQDQRDDEAVDDLAEQVATALAERDLGSLPLTGVEPAAAAEQLDHVTAGLGDTHPSVDVADVQIDGDTALVTLDHQWLFPGAAEPWTYSSRARLAETDGAWQFVWDVTAVNPDLDPGSRLRQVRSPAPRGEIHGWDGKPLVTERDVWHVGLDKPTVTKGEQEDSARRLAALLDIDADNFAAKVAAAGEQAFVVAITYRVDDKAMPSDDELDRIDGARKTGDRQMLAPTRTFARALLGTVGEATAEVIENSDGTIAAGDLVGFGGLQERYDEQLRGHAGVDVQLVPGDNATPEPSADPSAGPDPAEPGVLFSSAPERGADLQTSLDERTQRLAEDVLSDVGPASALVALQPSTGSVLAAAEGPGAEGQAVATTGRYAPGSTFKIISSLALLRAGMGPDSTVPCPETITVDGRTFENYDDYPADRLGDITLEQAVAHSCNTAFISQYDTMADFDLASAAGSLGLGLDQDLGFPAYFGEVPEDETETGRAAAMIGQGRVLASPLAMAGVAASVEAGHTVIPRLVDTSVEPNAEPLTKAEAKQLSAMMRTVVTDGSGRFLADLTGPTVSAKTGTAEYGEGEQPATHAWLIATRGDLAVAVFVADGKSGSTTAGPLLKEFLDRV